MRRIILHMMMSLDGFVASPDGSENWMTAPDSDRDAASLALALEVDTAIAGHGVYSDMAGYWPTARGETETQRDAIDRVNDMPKLIVSHQPADLSWNNAKSFTADSPEDLADKIRALKHEPGGGLVLWGGAGLVQQFARFDLIDEYQLMVQPIALGAGESPFATLEGWKDLRLVDCQQFATGAVMMTYTPAEPRATS